LSGSQSPVFSNQDPVRLIHLASATLAQIEKLVIRIEILRIKSELLWQWKSRNDVLGLTALSSSSSRWHLLLRCRTVIVILREFQWPVRHDRITLRSGIELGSIVTLA
jgi:hypothetical protein